MIQPLVPLRLTPFPVVLLALCILTVQGCFHSGGGGGGGTNNANPVGYYSSGDVLGGSIAVDDLQAMVAGNRIMMLSATNKLLYDGTITNITGNDFTANFTIYTDGENPITTTASGMITTNSSITGTLSGTGVGSGTFSLLYATTNDQAAAMVRTWAGAGGGFDNFAFIIDDTGSLVHKTTAGMAPFDTCQMNGTVIPVSGTRLYNVNVTMTLCNDSMVNGTYTGLTTTRDGTGTDDRLVFLISRDLPDDAYAFAGELDDDG